MADDPGLMKFAFYQQALGGQGTDRSRIEFEFFRRLWESGITISDLGVLDFGSNLFGWASIDKTGSSLADLATRSAADLSSGILPLARLANLTNAEIAAAAAIAYSKLNLAGSLVNADVHAAAAIAYAKLNLSAAIVNADIASGAAIAYAKLNLATSIVNADINASAAIASTKLDLSAIAQSLLFVDATHDIGASGATRPRDGFFSRNVTIGTLLTLTGGQVAFPATQAASSGLNTLDDYEETDPAVPFTPILGGSGGTSGQTYSRNVGLAVKIGKLVVATFDLILTAKGTITTNLQVQGFPFTVENAEGNRAVVACKWANMVDGADPLVTLVGEMNLNATTLNLFYATAVTGALTQASTTQVANNTEVRGTAIYRASA